MRCCRASTRLISCARQPCSPRCATATATTWRARAHSRRCARCPVRRWSGCLIIRGRGARPACSRTNGCATRRMRRSRCCRRARTAACRQRARARWPAARRRRILSRLSDRRRAQARGRHQPSAGNRVRRVRRAIRGRVQARLTRRAATMRAPCTCARRAHREWINRSRPRARPARCDRSSVPRRARRCANLAQCARIGRRTRLEKHHLRAAVRQRDFHRIEADRAAACGIAVEPDRQVADHVLVLRKLRQHGAQPRLHLRIAACDAAHRAIVDRGIGCEHRVERVEVARIDRARIRDDQLADVVMVGQRLQIGHRRLPVTRRCAGVPRGAPRRAASRRVRTGRNPVSPKHRGSA